MEINPDKIYFKMFTFPNTFYKKFKHKQVVVNKKFPKDKWICPTFMFMRIQ